MGDNTTVLTRPDKAPVQSTPHVPEAAVKGGMALKGEKQVCVVCLSHPQAPTQKQLSLS